MQKSITIFKNPNHAVPEDFLERVLKVANKAIGCSVQTGDRLVTARMRRDLTAKDVSNFINNENYLKEHLFISIQTEAQFDEDVGPYTLLEDQDSNPILVAFLDGDFTEFEQEKATHSEKHYAALEMVGQIQKLYAAANYDLKAMMESLYDDNFTIKALANFMLGDRGTITFLPASGNPMQINVRGDDSHREFDWGWASNHLGYAQEKEDNSLMGALSNALGLGSKSPEKKRVAAPPGMEKPAAAPGPAPTAPVPGPAPSSVPSGPGKETPVVNAGEMLTIDVPVNFKNNGKRRKWFEHRIPTGGPIPKDWMTAKTLTCDRGSATKEFMESYLGQNKMAGLGAALKTETAIPQKATSVPAAGKKGHVAPPPGMGPQPDVIETAKTTGEYPPGEEKKPVEGPPAKEKFHKDIETKHVTQQTEPAKSNGIIEGAPMVPLSEKKALLGIINSEGFKKAVDLHSQKMAEDPKKLQELEDKVPSITQQLGIGDLDTTLGWSFQELSRIAKECPAAMAVLAHNWRSEAMRWRQVADDLLKEKNEKKDQSVLLKATGTDNARTVNGTGNKKSRIAPPPIG